MDNFKEEYKKLIDQILLTTGNKDEDSEITNLLFSTAYLGVIEFLLNSLKEKGINMTDLSLDDPSNYSDFDKNVKRLELKFRDLGLSFEDQFKISAKQTLNDFVDSISSKVGDKKTVELKEMLSKSYLNG